MVKVSIKWGKESYADVDMDPADGLEGVHAVIFSLTNVPADRQKIIAAGKMIKDSSDVSKVINKDGIKLMVTGTADAIAEPVKKTVFLEDLSESEKMKAGSTDYLSAGLANLGNTCYMNSTLQSLRFIQPLKDGILSYMSKAGSSPSEADPNHTIVSQLGNLYRTMDNTTQPITPLAFTQNFRTYFPQFAERDDEGHWKQQDADECLNTLLTSIADKLASRLVPLPNSSSSSSSSSAAAAASATTPLSSLVPLAAPAGDAPAKPLTNLIDFLFSGDMESVWKCKESESEEEKKTIESFRKLRCPIDLKISYLSEGIEKDLNEELERRSEKLGRNAIWSRRSQISRLPPYLIIQFVRFFWKNDVKQKAKVLRKVEFPVKFDVFPFCANKLKTQLKAARRIIKDEQDAKIGISPLELAKKKAAEALEAKKKDKEGGAAATSSSSDTDKKDDKTKTEKNNSESLDEMANVDYIATSGYYEVFAVVTHKGRSADGGHYVSWVRTQPGSDKWLLFDDDKVSAKTTDDIKELAGGGDWHTAYLTLYRRIDDMTTFADRFKRIAQGLPPFTPEEIAEMQKAAGHGAVTSGSSK